MATKAIVIDNGSTAVRAGFSGDSSPKSVFPTLTGRSKESSHNEYCVGNEAWEKRGSLHLTYPIEHGYILNWDDIEKVWQLAFSDLNASAAERPVLLTESPCNPKINKEKTFEMMFERFNSCSVALANKATLGIYATGRLNGIVVQSGTSVTNFVPIKDGYAINQFIDHTDFAGSNLTDFMISMMKENGCNTLENPVNKFDSKFSLSDIKEKTSYVALDFEQEMLKSSEIEEQFELPDGGKITVGNERFRCPEAMFQPTLIGQEMPGIHQTIVNTIRKCPEEIRNTLFQNIILQGGNTLFNGMAGRVKKEIASLVPADTEINVIAPESSRYSAWIGGSILSSLETFPENCTTKQEYEEHGPSIVHKKFVDHKK